MNQPIPSPFNFGDFSKIQVSKTDIDKFILSTGAEAGLVVLFDEKVPCKDVAKFGVCKNRHDMKIHVYGVHPDFVDEMLHIVVESYAKLLEHQKNNGDDRKDS